jgi:hypothetical protein
VVPAKPYVLTSEKDLIVPGKYSNDNDRIKSVPQIIADSQEGDLFVIQKGVLSIYRFEDVLFSLFNHLTLHKRRGQTGKDVFMQFDPFNRNPAAVPQKQSLDMLAPPGLHHQTSSSKFFAF